MKPTYWEDLVWQEVFCDSNMIRISVEADGYLEPCQTSMMQFFCENS